MSTDRDPLENAYVFRELKLNMAQDKQPKLTEEQKKNIAAIEHRMRQKVLRATRRPPR